MDDYVYYSRYMNIENYERNRITDKPNGSMHNWLLPTTPWVKVGDDLQRILDWMDSKRDGAGGLNFPGKAYDKTLYVRAIIDGVFCVPSSHWRHMGRLIESRAGGSAPLEKNHEALAAVIYQERSSATGSQAREYFLDRVARENANARA